MKEIATEPVIPHELQPCWDDRAKEAHARLAAMTLERFWDSMPEVQMPDKGAGFVDLSPAEDHDRARAILLPLPYANGWAPHMAYRAKLLQDVLPEPTRIIILPNNTLGHTVAGLPKEELKKVAAGIFEPIVEQQFRSLTNAGVERFSVIGYSQGAALGATAIRVAAVKGDFGLGANGLFEWPNGFLRTSKELQKAFTGDGIAPLNKAINESAIPGLSEAQRSRGGFDTIRQLSGLALYGAGTVIDPVNRAIKQGFSRPRFTHDLTTGLWDSQGQARVFLASGNKSRITPQRSLQHIDIEKMYQLFPNRFGYKNIKGYGHELGDNIVAHALLARLALSR